MTNRALLLAALAVGATVLHRPLASRDTLLMVEALRALGVRVDADERRWVVHGTGTPLHPAAPDIDCGNAGTVARFVPPLATLASGTVRLDGDPRMRERPLAPLLTALRALGAHLEHDGPGLPVTVHGRGRLPGGAVDVDSSASSQLVSGLLLSAPGYDRGVRVRHHGPPVPSGPHLAMTVAMLRERGAQVDDTEPDSWQVRPGPLHTVESTVEPDLSSAAPFLAAALVTGGRVVVPDWPSRSSQPGAQLPDLLTAMGAAYDVTDAGLVLSGTGTVDGMDADLHEVGELTPVLVAVAAVAGSPSRFRGVAHLRGQETDRLAALAAELAGLGGRVRQTADGLLVEPQPLHGGLVRTYDDHRLAMAAAVLGLVVPGIEIENVATAAKTVPDFPGRWLSMLAGRP